MSENILTKDENDNEVIGNTEEIDTNSSNDDKDSKIQMEYENLVDFLEDYFFQLIRRKVGGQFTWCPQWWEHPEAISRLDALWLSWEALKNESALSMSDWWLNHADPHLRVLMSREEGPFAFCRPDMHRDDLKPLPAMYIDRRLFQREK